MFFSRFLDLYPKLNDAGLPDAGDLVQCVHQVAVESTAGSLAGKD